MVNKPDHDLTIRDVFRIYTRDRDEIGRLVAIPQMSDSWKRWAEGLLQKAAKARPRTRLLLYIDRRLTSRRKKRFRAVWRGSWLLFSRAEAGNDDFAATFISIVMTKPVNERAAAAAG